VRRLILDHADGAFNRKDVTALAGTGIRYTQVLTELISTRYSEPLTLTSIAKLARVHPTTANRAFRDILGISVMEYLTRFRLARAMHRLAETDDRDHSVLRTTAASVRSPASTISSESGQTPRRDSSVS
jgi:transcriptional regulator GlxA family with amidase domain